MQNLLSVFFALPLLAADKPNILFILADDLGIKDLSCEGSAFYETPHIDSIAVSGIRLPTATPPAKSAPPLVPPL